DPLRPAVRSVLSTGHVTGKNLFAVRILSAGVEFLQRGNLRCGEAIARILTFAEQHGRIDVTPQRIADDPVFHSILSITGSQGGSLNGGELGAGDIRRRILAVHV